VVGKFIFIVNLVLVVLILLSGPILLSRYVHRNDDILKQRCEEAGGLFIRASSPLVACVKEVKF
jgi:hypothetical protein